jgi:nucleotidyltransferase AbiEii toxin of type IV toxin-antitoxin system
MTELSLILGELLLKLLEKGMNTAGIRVTLDGRLSHAAIRLHVDVNVGDPISPEPQYVSLPRLLDGVLQVRGYPREMVLAEKVATAIARGTANTRWRDFVDLYSLANRHRVSGTTFRASLDRVAQHRKLTLAPLASLLVGYSELASARWVAWLRKQRLESTIPTELSAVLDYDPVGGRNPAVGTSRRRQEETGRL